MATNTANRAQLFQVRRGRDFPDGLGHYATRRLRTSVYRTSDGMTRELHRPVRD